MECVFCDYKSDRKYNIDKHIKACQYRIKNRCLYCQNDFASSSSLSRHIKICNIRIDKEKELENEINKIKSSTEITLLKQKIVFYDELMEANKVKIDELESEAKYYKDLIIGAGNLAHKTVSAFGYVMKKYENAPCLTCLDDYKVIHPNMDDAGFVREISYSFEKKTLAAFIGNFIIQFYKKDDPSIQALWNSDTSRFTYFIKQLFNEKGFWKVDKKGITVKEIIIDPMIDYILNLIKSQVQNICNFNKTNSAFLRCKEIEDNNKYLLKLTEIKQEIDLGNVSNDVLKYISPFFYLDRSKQVVAQIK